MWTKLQMKIFNIKVNSITKSCFKFAHVHNSIMYCPLVISIFVSESPWWSQWLVLRCLFWVAWKLECLQGYFWCSLTSLSSCFIGAMFSMLFESYMNFLMVLCKWSLCNWFIAAMFAIVFNSVLTFGNLILSSLWLQCLQWNLTYPCTNFWWGFFYDFPFVVGSFYLKSLQGYLIP